MGAAHANRREAIPAGPGSVGVLLGGWPVSPEVWRATIQMPPGIAPLKTEASRGLCPYTPAAQNSSSPAPASPCAATLIRKPSRYKPKAENMTNPANTAR